MCVHSSYDSFGQVTGESDPTVGFRFGYTGRELDEETGLYYYRARYYDAAVGRFVSEDTIGFSGGDANLYRYVGNSPLNYTDPSGNFVFAILAAPAIPVATKIAIGVGAIATGLILNNIKEGLEKIDLSPNSDFDPNYGSRERGIALPNFEIPSFPNPVGDLFDNIFKFPGDGSGSVPQTETFPNSCPAGLAPPYLESSGLEDFLHPNPDNLLTRPGQIANQTGYSTRQINDAIHKIKTDPSVRANMGRSNPDIGVESETGEVFIQLEKGKFSGDSIGNIFDHLSE